MPLSTLETTTIFQNTLLCLCDVLHTDLIITTGGTGFGPRDVTPEATKRVLHRDAPQLALVMSLYSLEKTKFAALSRAVCGLRNGTLIINMPGSRKAVTECFAAIQPILPHALQHMQNDVTPIRATHTAIQQPHLNEPTPASAPSVATSHGVAVPVAPAAADTSAAVPRRPHVCPHKTGTGGPDDRNSIYPMVPVDQGVSIILQSLRQQPPPPQHQSPLNLPPFPASIKDGYAMKANGGAGPKRVVGSVAAGDALSQHQLADDECFKINTGAAVPADADCVVQVEDTELLEETAADASGVKREIRVLIKTTPYVGQDIRPIGCDMEMHEDMFTADPGCYPERVAYSSILASVGQFPQCEQPLIGIVSTGDELTALGEPLADGCIYDSNTTMLVELCRQFGFTAVKTRQAPDTYAGLREAVLALTAECSVTICTGGVSMGDRDYVKAVLADLDFDIHFGRVNMKPGKPMTYAAHADGRAVFGLPGNPVSAFVTFHLFVLPALRHVSRCAPAKLALPLISVTLLHDWEELDARPEYARATVTSQAGGLYASVTGNQVRKRGTGYTALRSDLFVYFECI